MLVKRWSNLFEKEATAAWGRAGEPNPTSDFWPNKKYCSSHLVINFLGKVCTLPETNISHLKMDGWNTILSFWGPVYFQRSLLLVSGNVFHFFVQKSEVLSHSSRLCWYIGLGDVLAMRPFSMALQSTGTCNFSGWVEGWRRRIWITAFKRVCFELLSNR